MTNAKQRVREVLEQLPDDCSIDEVVYRLYVIDTIEKRLRAAEGGAAVAQDEVERRLAKWEVAGR